MIWFGLAFNVHLFWFSLRLFVGLFMLCFACVGNLRVCGCGWFVVV